MSPEIRVTVNEEVVARAAATIREAGRQLAATIGRLEGYTVEPWTLETNEGTLTGYVDAANQEHWVADDRLISPTWRKLYVQKRPAPSLFGDDAGDQCEHADGCRWPLEQCIGHPA